MHEMSLAESMLQVVEESARREGATRVRTVILEIGRLAAVEAEALRFCFEAVARDTLAAQARLEIIDIAGRGRCTHCGAETLLHERYALCPSCGHHSLQITAGDTMRVREIEIE